MKLGHLAITVKNMEESVRFYTTAFGVKQAFELSRPETGEPWIVYLYVGDGQFIELFYGGEKEYSWDEHDRAYNHVCFTVEDIHAAVKQIEDAGYTMRKAPKIGIDGNWQAWIDDPDGVRIEIMQLGESSPHMKAIRELSL